MKEIKDQIAVMQHAAKGGKVRVSNRMGHVTIIDAKSLRWNWAENDYDIVKEPKRFWVNEYRIGIGGVHDTESGAKKAARGDAIRVAVEFVEVVKVTP